jgi:hypothetical protein
VCPRRFRAYAWNHVPVSERLPQVPDLPDLPDLPGLPEPRPAGRALERRRERQLEQPLTPAERRMRRRNRKLLASVAVPGILLGAAALAATLASGSGPPPPRPLAVPAGYQAVNDGVFAYAVPRTWSENLAYSDDTGDLDFSGTSGWAGEYLGARGSAPGPGEATPASFAAFGESRPTAFTMGPAEKVTVAGATVAYRYQVTRPGGFQAVAIDAWRSSSGAEIWLLVHAPAQVTSTIIGSLNAS